jgi:serine/threonine protein kinase
MDQGDDTAIGSRLGGPAGGGGRAALPPDTIVSGTYRILRKIAAGGMGVVYEAEHIRLPGHKVALKVLMPEVAGDLEALARFRREAEICTRLQHPNIIRVSDFNVLDDGTPYLVMDYLEGESLTIHMAKGTMTKEEAFDVLHQIGAALEAAHRQGVVHRDLKPSNVFMLKFDPASTGAGQPTVKVLDFGISKMLAEATLVSDPNSGILGSPSYMSPEQAEARNREVGPASDQFSLASIAVELLTEKKAFSGEIPSSILFQVVHREPDGMDIIDRDYPPCVGQAVRRALDKDPTKRFPSIAEFLEALGHDYTAPDMPTAPQKKPEVATPWWKNALAILLLVGLIAAGTYLALTSPVWGLIFSEKPPAAPPPPAKDRPPKTAPAATSPAASEAAEPDQTAEDNRAAYLAAEARRHYDKKKYHEAIRLATQSVAVKPNGDAHVLITLSFCALKQDKDALIWLEKVPQARKKSTMAQCRYLGMNLENKADKK